MNVSPLRWLAVIPLVPAAPLLFFGLLWLAPVQLLVGLGLVLVGAALWRLLADEWNAWPFHARV